MELHYTLTQDDLVRFNMYHFANSKPRRRIKIINGVVLPAVILLFGLYEGLINHDLLDMMFCLVLSVLFFVLFNLVYDRLAKKSIVKALSAGNNEGMTGERTLTIGRDGITEKSATSEDKYTGRFINFAASDDLFHYLYLTSVTALIVPRSAFESPEAEAEFLEQIKAFLRPSPGMPK